MALLLLATCYVDISTWQQDWQLTHRTPAPRIHQAVKTPQTTSPLPKQHLFGNTANPLGHMPISNLQLRVVGIASTDHPREASKAYISIAGNPGKIVRIGDPLPYGVKVYDITKDTVIVENNGQLEKLPLPREPLSFKPKPNQEHA